MGFNLAFKGLIRCW